MSSAVNSGMAAPIQDMKLNELGEALGDDPNLMTLGLKLGFLESKVRMFLATNRTDGIVSSKGTKNMLFAWRNKTPGANQAQDLRNALMDADLRHIADKYLSNLP